MKPRRKNRKISLRLLRKKHRKNQLKWKKKFHDEEVEHHTRRNRDQNEESRKTKRLVAVFVYFQDAPTLTKANYLCLQGEGTS